MLAPSTLSDGTEVWGKTGSMAQYSGGAFGTADGRRVVTYSFLPTRTATRDEAVEHVTGIVEAALRPAHGEGGRCGRIGHMSEQQPNPYANDPAGQGGQPGTPGQGEYKWGPGEASYGYPQPYPAAPAYQPTIGGAGLPAPGYPAAAPAGGAGLSLGDITIAGDQIITPSGPMPLKGAMWNATDFSRTEEKIPPHAIVLAIVFFLFCLLGLLFLLMKEKTTTGYIQVTVTSGGRHHSTMIPATNAGTYQWVMSQVNYARSLSF